MNYKHLFILFFSISIFNSFSQSNNEKVLFTVDNEPVYVSEFIRVYNKNLDLVQDESQKGVDEYLLLFTNYKLKLKEATTLKLQDKPSYIRELATYKNQLAKSYMTDANVTDELVKEAYDRVSNEVKAAHILVKVAENASPKDTLEAYNSIVKLRNRALKEGFETVRKEVHNGQTVYGEDLGYFGGFRMVYKFENAAFNTKVGDISQPFRTQFGYHIVNGEDREPMPVGEFILEDGNVMKVDVEGIIAAIEMPEEEMPENEEEVASPAEEEMSAETASPKKVVKSITEEMFFSEIEKLRNEIAELKLSKDKSDEDSC